MTTTPEIAHISLIEDHGPPWWCRRCATACVGGCRCCQERDRAARDLPTFPASSETPQPVTEWEDVE